MEYTVTPGLQKGTSGAILKNIAVITMLTDHVGYAIVEPMVGNSPESGIGSLYVLLRMIGRIAFPIFCFLIGQGAIHTSSKVKYLLRLAVFALISEIPFNLVTDNKCFYPYYQNVFFTLCLGLLLIYVYEYLYARHRTDHISRFAFRFWFILAMIFICLAAFFLLCDYGATGVLLIFILWFFRSRPRHVMILGFFMLTFVNAAELGLSELMLGGAFPSVPAYIAHALNESPSVIAFMLISQYNGLRGKQLHKYFYYAFYPVHLLILWLISGII